MTELTVGDFPDFFEEVYGYAPFPWQANLAEKVTTHGWPDRIQMPSGTGKTAAIDVAVFNLAMQAGEPDRDAPTRIFYTIDRRVVVDQAHERACELAEALQAALTRPEEMQVTRAAASQLRKMATDDEPLVAERMRGGLHRDEVWFADPTQPAVYPTTVDQIGSRLLFRGYGVSDSMKPVHAGLAGTDALYILDEVHLSQPFQETLAGVEELRPRERFDAPFTTVSMSATPVQEGWSSPKTWKEDQQHEILGPRLESAKQATLTKTEVRGKENGDAHHAHVLARHAADLVNLDAEPPRDVIGVIVNTVSTARTVYEALNQVEDESWEGKADAVLVVGRARSWEREQVVETDLEQVKAPRPRDGSRDAPLFVVATQTIEVGADLDFDGLVTEIAPIDALRQRVGRLDRFGDLGTTNAYIVARDDWVEPSSTDQVQCRVCGESKDSLGGHLRSHDMKKEEYIQTYWEGAWEASPEHPVYGRSLKPTWDWLQERAENGTINLGATGCSLPDGERRKAMCAPKEAAPMLLTPHLDLLCQTSPKPQPSPEISLYLHGPDTTPGEVQVIWRRDLLKDTQETPELVKENEAQYDDTVALRPPLPLESVDLPIWAVREWLREVPHADDIPDTEGGTPPRRDEGSGHEVLLWRGREKATVSLPAEIQPGDTVIVPAQYGGHDEYAFNPTPDQENTPVRDLSNLAPIKTEGEDPTIALTPPLVQQMLPDETAAELLELELDPRIEDGRKNITDALKLLAEHAEAREVRETAEALSGTAHATIHPVYREELEGNGYPVLFPKPSQEGQGVDGEAVWLEPHSNEVEANVNGYVSRIRWLPREIADEVEKAAPLHDVGKMERRFQSWMRGGEPVQPQEELLAKSPIPAGTPQSRRARMLAGYPEGRRHEAISAQLINENGSTAAGFRKAGLVTYLIGTHHGYGRPLFPTPNGKQKSDRVDGTLLGHEFRAETTFHQYELSSGWPDLFWELTRQYGPWSLAYLEALLRIADQKASQEVA